MTDMINSSFFPTFKNEIIPMLVDSYIMSKVMQCPTFVVENVFVEVQTVKCEITNFSQYMFAKSIVENQTEMKKMYESFPDVKGSQNAFTKSMIASIEEFESSPDFIIMNISFTSENPE